MSTNDKTEIPLYSYKEFLNTSGYSQETVDAVREKISRHEIIPKYITNGQVNFGEKNLKSLFKFSKFPYYFRFYRT